MSEWKFVVGAYALTWFVLLVYAVRLRRRIDRARRELQRVPSGAPEA